MVKAFNSKNLKEHGRFEDDMPDWMDDLVKISFKETRQLTLRPVTPMIMMARHWPVSLTSGKNCPPIWCPKFNSETQKFDLDYACHMHDDFGERWKAQKVIIFGAIVREWQEDGKKNPVGLIVLPGSTSVALVQIVGINKYDISDPQKGCDINVVNAKDAPPANQWQIQRTERTPLTDAEKAYKIPDLDKLSPDFGDPKFLAMFSKEMKRKLANFGYYVSPKDNDEEGWAAYKKDVGGQPYTDFPELAALVGDGKKDKDGKPSDSKKKKRADDDAPAGGKLRRQHEIVDDEDEAPPAKKSKAPPVDDDDDEADEDDEDEKPAPKKKIAPPPDDDDEDEKPAPKKKAAPPPDDEDDEDEKPAPKKKAAPPPDDDEDEAPPAKKSKSSADKDDDAEPPFDVDDDEDEKPKASKLKVLSAPDGVDEDWVEAYSITWKKNDDGKVVPKCFGVFAGAKKCKACPARKPCTIADVDG
jgi:hypothetical protein